MKEKNKSQTVIEIENRIKSILTENGYNLVDIDITGGKKTIISIFLYGEGKMNHDNLQSISGKIYPLIENLPHIENFLLEVSSPGLYRKIKSKHEFEIFTGRNVKVVNDKGTVFNGIIIDFKNDVLSLKNGDNIIKINLIDIRSAGLNG